jgi:predicted GIY-YIG superfamily endonuclease
MLSKRANNCLARAGIDTVDVLLSYTANDLERLPWLGRVTMKELVGRLSEVGLSLRQDGLPLTQLQQSAWAYILLSERGEIYLGATTNLRSRLKAHNSSRNSGWTKGRRWHILGVRLFESRYAAFSYEQELKKHPHKKITWKLQCIERASRIVVRHGYQFNPNEWLHSHHDRLL